MDTPRWHPTLSVAHPTDTASQHLLTLPAVQDGVRAFQANPLGKMSVQLTNSAYQLVAAPVLSLLYKPLSYVTPYAQRVDEIGDETLSRVEEKYPVVKKPAPELYQEAKKVAYAPVEHVTRVYRRAYQRTPGGHVVATGKAAAKTAIVVGFESAIFALREAIKLTDSLQINEYLKSAVDGLEAAIVGTQNEAPAEDANHEPTQNGAAENGSAEPEGQDEPGSKTSND